MTNTVGTGIANNGTIVGNVSTPSYEGFLRYADGTFSPTFAFPGALTTSPGGVNSSNLVCGTYYTTGTSSYHGFFYDGVAFTQYDVPGATNTYLLGINDAGDTCGYYNMGAGSDTGFINVGGTLLTFTAPGATGVFARGLNNLGQVVGNYLDARAPRFLSRREWHIDLSAGWSGFQDHFY